MLRLALSFLLLTTLGAHAALNLVAHELFTGTGVLTSASTDSFTTVSGTITPLKVGAYSTTGTITAPGSSGEVRVPGTVVSGVGSWGEWNFTADSNPRMLGMWIRVKTYSLPGGSFPFASLYNSNGQQYFLGIDSNGDLYFQINGSTKTTSSFQVPLNTWTYVGWEWQYLGSGNAKWNVAAQTLGGTFQSSVMGSTSTPLYDTRIVGVAVGMQVPAYGPLMRFSCPSLYTMGSYASDFTYPGDITPPVEQPYNWYVNPVTGRDTYDGSTPGTAWQTAAKVNTESQYCGMLDSNATGAGNGDVLTIDTSGTPLVIGANTLTFNTQGLRVQPASGQSYIKCQAEEFLANSAFTATSGLAKTYQTLDTQTDAVAWENDEWMWHVKAATFSSTATVTNPDTNTSTTYASAGAALDAMPGSFYTDGNTLYVHPFSDTNPNSDGNTYTRSINRGGGLAAVAFTAGNYLANGFYVRKTALADSNDSDIGAYCFQDGVLTGTGLTCEVENSYFAYGDKHCFASTDGVTNSSLLVLNTECEQGQPYTSYGGQTPFVSYSGTVGGNNVHTYRGCTCLARSGLIGSTAGDPVGTGGDIILSHDNGAASPPFSSIYIDGCNFGSGSIDLSAASNLFIYDHTQAAEVLTGCTSTTINETAFTSQVVQMETGAASLLLENCLIKPVFALSPTHPAYYGVLLQGNVDIQGCTFDLSGLTGDSSSYFLNGFIQRLGSLSLTFENNVYLVPSGENYPVLYGTTSTDTLTFDHNAYSLGSGTTFGRNIGASASLTFTQWQSGGQDCVNSSLNANLNLQSDVPQAGSPLINAGIDPGSGPDYTGSLFAHRNTIGAYEYSGSYLAPQTIANFPATQQESQNQSDILPASTSAGLPITYSLVSGPARLQGDTLTFTGTGTVELEATQGGNSTNAPLTELEFVNVTVAMAAASDTPALPTWALVLLGGTLALAAARSLRTLPRA